ncbi:MAG TPA: AsmA-like C-terminal region-containing protein, partial [Gemmataceae bacterium]|nr:AsmA-like C-terminal region-containing protein [Gemmataceae bacterium]
FSTGLAWNKVTGTVGMRGRYNGRSLAGVTGNVLLDEATLLGQPFHNLRANLKIEESAPDVLLVDLKAPLFGGDISGEARIEFNSSHRYELHLTGSQLDLGQFGQHNLGPTSKLQGAAMAQLHLTGQGSRGDTLDGNGSIDVPTGHLYNLPLLLDILKFLGLRWPDRTAFDELHALFSIHGQRVSVRKLELLGNAVSLTGQGEFNLDGTNVALDFYPGWARLYQLLPPALRPLPPNVSKNLLTIKMRGKVTANDKDRKFTMKPVPGIVDPLLHVRDLLTGAPSRENRDEPRMLPELGSGR